MLTARKFNIVSCWIVEISPKGNEAKEILNIKNDNFELIRIVTLGYSVEKPVNPGRKKYRIFFVSWETYGTSRVTLIGEKWFDIRACESFFVKIENKGLLW